MISVWLEDPQSWRQAAGQLLAQQVQPDQVGWTEGAEQGLFESGPVAPPRAWWREWPEFERQAEAALCHRDPARFGLLYRLLWRLSRGEAELLERVTEPDVHRLLGWVRAVDRDCHDLKAYVRFRQCGDSFVAWHRTAHHTLARTAPFFVRRFRTMRWAILTPDRSAYWNGADLRFGPGMPRSSAPASDQLESLWKTYYANIFNPARVNPKAMRREMPHRHWPTLPETALIDELVRGAEERVQRMSDPF